MIEEELSVSCHHSMSHAFLTVKRLQSWKHEGDKLWDYHILQACSSSFLEPTYYALLNAGHASVEAELPRQQLILSSNRQLTSAIRYVHDLGMGMSGAQIQELRLTFSPWKDKIELWGGAEVPGKEQWSWGSNADHLAQTRQTWTRSWLSQHLDFSLLLKGDAMRGIEAASLNLCIRQRQTHVLIQGYFNHF